MIKGMIGGEPEQWKVLFRYEFCFRAELTLWAKGRSGTCALSVYPACFQCYAFRKS